ncbi:MAG: hypothetical protein RSC76_05505, partial [Oscillospiraceae bacterium]
DVFPHSDVGQLISMISSLFGIAVIAMPAGVVTAGFMDEINRDKAKNSEKNIENKMDSDTEKELEKLNEIEKTVLGAIDENTGDSERKDDPK